MDLPIYGFTQSENPTCCFSHPNKTFTTSAVNGNCIVGDRFEFENITFVIEKDVGQSEISAAESERKTQQRKSNKNPYYIESKWVICLRSSLEDKKTFNLTWKNSKVISFEDERICTDLIRKEFWDHKRTTEDQNNVLKTRLEELNSPMSLEQALSLRSLMLRNGAQFNAYRIMKATVTEPYDSGESLCNITSKLDASPLNCVRRILEDRGFPKTQVRKVLHCLYKYEITENTEEKRVLYEELTMPGLFKGEGDKKRKPNRNSFTNRRRAKIESEEQKSNPVINGSDSKQIPKQTHQSSNFPNKRVKRDILTPPDKLDTISREVSPSLQHKKRALKPDSSTIHQSTETLPKSKRPKPASSFTYQSIETPPTRGQSKPDPKPESPSSFPQEQNVSHPGDSTEKMDTSSDVLLVSKKSRPRYNLGNPNPHWKQISVGYIPLECERSTLEELFGRFGEVQKLNLRNDLGINVATVTYRAHDEAKLAMESLHASELMKRKLVVKWPYKMYARVHFPARLRPEFREAFTDIKQRLTVFFERAISKCRGDNHSFAESKRDIFPEKEVDEMYPILTEANDKYVRYYKKIPDDLKFLLTECAKLICNLLPIFEKSPRVILRRIYWTLSRPGELIHRKGAQVILSERDVREFGPLCVSDPSAPVSTDGMTEKKADEFEGRISEFLNNLGIRHVVAAELKHLQKSLFGHSTTLPDILLLDNLYINGNKIYWIDAKNFYGGFYHRDCLHMYKAKQQGSNYYERIGDGAFLYRASFCDKYRTQASPIVVLDDGPLRDASLMSLTV